MKKQIVRLCVGIGAAFALLGSARPARAQCQYIYNNGSGYLWYCFTGGPVYTWKPCNVSAVTYNSGLWGSCFGACKVSACGTSDPNSYMNSCMLNNGSPWSCGTCP
jgi:hypothetical protein